MIFLYTPFLKQAHIMSLMVLNNQHCRRVSTYFVPDVRIRNRGE